MKVAKIFFKFMDVYYKIKGLKNEGKLYHPVMINFPSKVEIGKGTTIGPFVWIVIQNSNGYLKIGKNSEITAHCSLLCGYGVEIGNHVHIGPGVQIISATNYYKPRWEIWKNPLSGGKVVIEDNVHIGANAVILPNIKIEEGAIVGAGAVVTKNVPRGAIVAGVPAKIIKYRSERRDES